MILQKTKTKLIIQINFNSSDVIKTDCKLHAKLLSQERG